LDYCGKALVGKDNLDKGLLISYQWQGTEPGGSTSCLVNVVSLVSRVSDFSISIYARVPLCE
jgi:hypothetical protein